MSQLRLEQSQRQSLVMSPMMQQAVALLVMSSLELQQHVQQEMEQNPTLEVELPEEETPDEEKAKETKDEEKTAKDEKADETGEGESESGETDEKDDSPMDEMDYENLFSSPPSGSTASTSSNGDSETSNVIEETATSDVLLSDYLISQLAITEADDDLIRVAALIISRLNPDGFLGTNSDQFAALVGEDPVMVRKALEIIKTFDPAGVGAIDARESLLIQLERQGRTDELAYRILVDHFEDMAKNKVPQIAKALDVEIDDITEAIEEIKQLEPRPGRSFGHSDATYVIPDVIVEKINGEYNISLRNDRVPRVRISNYYLKLFREEKKKKNEVSQYLKDKLDNALLLIKSIEKRQNTIYRVAESIVRHQTDFFEYGPKYLKPMTLRIVADDLGIHESTVSRVTTQKYMQSPQGVHELKFFFTSSISTLAGEDASARSVKTILREIVEAEDPKNPLSDQKIAQLLGKRGFSIARRTVTKYREQLQIPAAKQRIQY